MVTVVESISLAVGFALLLVGFLILYVRHANIDGDIVFDIIVYSFVTGGSVGVFISATYFAFTGQPFLDTGGLFGLGQVIGIGGTAALFSAGRAYVRKLRRQISTRGIS